MRYICIIMYMFTYTYIHTYIYIHICMLERERGREGVGIMPDGTKYIRDGTQEVGPGMGMMQEG